MHRLWSPQSALDARPLVGICIRSRPIGGVTWLYIRSPVPVERCGMLKNPDVEEPEPGTSEPIDLGPGPRLYAKQLRQHGATVVLSHDYLPPRRSKLRVQSKRSCFVAAVSLSSAAMAVLSLAIAHRVVDGAQLNWNYRWLCASAAGTVAMMALASRPDLKRAAGAFLEELIEAGREALVAGMVLVIVGFFWRPGSVTHFSFSRGTVLLTVPLLFVFVGGARVLLRSLLLSFRQRGHNLSSIVVIGDSNSAASFMQTIERQTGTGYRIVAHITDPDGGGEIARALHQISTTMPIDEVVIATHGLSARQIQAIVAHPSMRAVRVRAVPELFGLPPSKVQVVSLADFPLLTLCANPVRGARWKVKRALDMAVSLGALVVLSPVLAAIAIAIRLDSKGPVLFRQERVGMDGKPIELLKFRTMTAGADDLVHREFIASMLKVVPAPSSSTGFYKLTDDPRITRLGRALRRFSLDELPQLVNVLKGDMSLVGPRPALEYETEMYEEWQFRRFDVLPGMTGLWQVSGRSRLTPADMLRLDVHYAETWSLWKDFLIIVRTIPAVLGDNAR
jgi:exopolysaccharide biosynthesis polyprenyl glycosylphosphotransferase